MGVREPSGPLSDHLEVVHAQGSGEIAPLAAAAPEIRDSDVDQDSLETRIASQPRKVGHPQVDKGDAALLFDESAA